ncbi:type I restriction endonuclease subunit S [Actinobacillus pleuropneumoniae]|uniref:Putative Type I restriction enzyme EcoR124II specificity protein n=2 Tax=Actinobacillus pleuropneumoniae TaxID=715 RepID=A3MZ10_ACTP2|nr:restriction endonuclease subunit S [Actinobacillus pleuropneumoniae]ABN73396.1 putative Type I restriction enzyme EcoR124II specificity protein [Actinobacillus pleuropneumoniae serovar 5b str. L20]QSZ38267.1 type I restriction endonuclease subunit S [Actinobacillus pleuropneumoniae]UKH09496.1 restriction endonuclease subunit S [Actinobacillus pleuropneumoniae]UPK77399.1 restriction endonuclease subunit S [Actinobacillus pleuropneumoniae]
MNILELIKDCEVEWKSLGEVAKYEQPTKYLVKSTNYNDDFNTPVLTAGKTFILGYTDEIDGIYPAKSNPIIIFDDFTTANKWVDFDFKVKSSAMKMITSSDENKFSLKYIYYWLNTLPMEDNTDHKRQWISNFANKKIPIPPLEIQEKIVKTLDIFTKLEAELSLRVKQYDYYRNELLTFDDDVEFITLDKISENLNSMRKPIKSGLREKGRIPYYGASGIVDYVEDYIFDDEILLISEDGANLIARNTPIAFSVLGKCWVNNHAHVLKFKTDVERKFVEFYLNNLDLSPFISGAAQPKLNKQNLNKIPIPNITFATQQKIVDILDKFDRLPNSISDGLPKEIELRRKQYEYYRERLLNFPKSE